MTESVRTTTASQLSHMAGVSHPDSPTSLGSEWLTDLRDAAVERFDYLNAEGDDISPEADWHDVATEMIAENDNDGPYIVGTYRAWSVFIELSAYEEDLSDLGVESIPADDVYKLPAYALGIVAQRLLVQVLEGLAEEAADPFTCESRSLWSDSEFKELNREGSAIDAWQFLAQYENDARMREVAAIDRDDEDEVLAFYERHGLNNDPEDAAYGTGELHGILASDAQLYTYRVSNVLDPRA